MKVEFLRAAEEELLEVALRYEEEREGLGSDFLAETRRLRESLSTFPGLGERLDSGFRRISLRRFPYALIFRCEVDTVRVVAVAHRRRMPAYWRPRGVFTRPTGTN